MNTGALFQGLSDVQTSRGEQRYETQLEAKLIRRGSPVILMGNITKQVGRKMAFSVSLVNVLKDKAFLSGKEEGTNQQQPLSLWPSYIVSSFPFFLLLSPPIYPSPPPPSLIEAQNVLG